MNRRGQQNVRWLTRMALLTAVAVVLGYIEHLIPMPGGHPRGIKLGLANTVLLYSIYLLDAKSAFLLMILKVGLSGLWYGGVSAMMFSFGGGLCSLVMMLLVKKLGGEGVSILGVSVVGAVFHNAGQTGRGRPGGEYRRPDGLCALPAGGRRGHRRPHRHCRQVCHPGPEGLGDGERVHAGQKFQAGA